MESFVETMQSLIKMLENLISGANKVIAFRDKVNNKYGDVFGHLFAMLSGLIFVLLASSWTSPIFEGSYGYDSAFFSMVGRAINNGKVMYRDYFDIKGPVFFFWEALGQRICTDRNGIFVLQCICIMGATFFLYRICKMYMLSWQKTAFVFLIFYFIYTTTLWGGNSVEEYCLPLNMACIYYGLRFLKGMDETVDSAFLYGFTFGVCTLSKITVAAPMCAIMLVIFIKLIVDKDYKKIGRCVIEFVIGALVVAVPVFVYYYINDALDDMLLCSFKIAFARGTDYYEGFSLKWELYLTSCYVGLIYWFTKAREKGIEKWVLLSLTVITFIALHLGTPFDYYFTTTLPLVSYICILFGVDIQKVYTEERMSLHSMRRLLRKILLALFGIIVICGAYFTKTIDKFKENHKIATEYSEVKFYNDCREAYLFIPESERDDLFCIESGMIFYEVNQILPSSKYPVNMPYFCQLYPPAEDYIVNILDTQTPKWIVAENIDEVDNEAIKEAVYRHYEQVFSNSMDTLWCRIDE